MTGVTAGRGNDDVDGGTTALLSAPRGMTVTVKCAGGGSSGQDFCYRVIAIDERGNESALVQDDRDELQPGARERPWFYVMSDPDSRVRIGSPRPPRL